MSVRNWDISCTVVAKHSWGVCRVMQRFYPAALHSLTLFLSSCLVSGSLGRTHHACLPFIRSNLWGDIWQAGASVGGLDQVFTGTAFLLTGNTRHQPPHVPYQAMEVTDINILKVPTDSGGRLLRLNAKTVYCSYMLPQIAMCWLAII